MRISGQSRSHAWSALGLAVLALPGLALANADVEKNIANPGNWAMQAGDMFNQRYSKLKQINTSNVGKMQVAWTFSTGVLRGQLKVKGDRGKALQFASLLDLPAAR